MRLNEFEGTSQLRSLIEVYVTEQNGELPHSAFDGQTPDEMYFGTGADVPRQLADTRAEARARRLAENRARRCAVCA